MAVVPCRRNDGGLCKEPDLADSAPAALVMEGNISLVSQPLINRLFPDGFELESGNGVFLAEMSDEQYTANVYEAMFTPDRTPLQYALLEAIGDDDGVLVACDCGHRYVYRIRHV